LKIEENDEILDYRVSFFFSSPRIYLHFDLDARLTDVLMSNTSWPPHITPAQEAAILSLASDYSLSHGLVYRPLPTSPSTFPSTTSSIHAPYSLFPALFPRELFEQAIKLQKLYNLLYARVADDDDLLREVVGGAVSKVDEFQRRLYAIWETVGKEGVTQVRRCYFFPGLRVMLY
jgi:hypothetical protein